MAKTVCEHRHFAVHRDAGINDFLCFGQILIDSFGTLDVSLGYYVLKDTNGSWAS